MHIDIASSVAYDRGYQSAKRKYKNSGPEWVDVMEHVPELERRLLYFFDGCGGAFLGFYFGRDKEYPGENDHVFGNGSGYLTGDVTHWMYLPKYPIDHDWIEKNDAANAAEITESVLEAKKPIRHYDRRFHD